MKDTIAAISANLAEIQKEYQSGHATEHMYRPALRDLFVAFTSLEVHYEPKGSAHGRPDLILREPNQLPKAHAEAKDLCVDLDKVEKSDQMDATLDTPILFSPTAWNGVSSRTPAKTT